MNANRIGAVIAKEFHEVGRDPVTIGIALLLPMVMLFLFGYAVTLDVRDVRLGVWDRDQTPASRALTDAFVQSGYFRFDRAFASGEEAEIALQRGAVRLALVLPERFQARLARGEAVPVQILVDGTFSNIAMVVANYADAIVHSFGYPGDGHLGDGAVRTEARIWYNPEMRSVNYIVPGLYGVILMALPPLLTALAIVREKESGAIQQIFASPLTPAEYILGKLVPYGLIAFVQIALVMAAGFYWFNVPFRGNLGFLVGAGVCQRRMKFGPSAFSVQVSTLFTGFHKFCSKIKALRSAAERL